MTETELQARCEALASVGDNAAKATLELIQEVRRLRAAPASEREQHAIFVLTRIAQTIDTARALGLLPIGGGQARLSAMEALRAANRPMTLADRGGGKPIALAESNGNMLSPEEVAAAATHAANGLGTVTDPAATAVNPTLPAGHYDKTPKMDCPKPAGG